jgi:hypothetical protein
MTAADALRAVRSAVWLLMEIALNGVKCSVASDGNCFEWCEVLCGF